MKVKDILKDQNFILVSGQEYLEKDISNIYCSDLLSCVMSHGKKDNVYITVLTNVNVIGVATLLEFSCVIFSEENAPNKEIIKKANENKLPLIKTNLSNAMCIIKLYNMGVLK